MSVVRSEWASFDEMMEAYECAPSEEVWALNVAWSVMPIPGLRWHCDECRFHIFTPTALQVPRHCGAPMSPEDAMWLQEEMDARIETVASLMQEE